MEWAKGWKTKSQLILISVFQILYSAEAAAIDWADTQGRVTESARRTLFQTQPKNKTKIRLNGLPKPYGETTFKLERIIPSFSDVRSSIFTSDDERQVLRTYSIEERATYLEITQVDGEGIRVVMAPDSSYTVSPILAHKDENDAIYTGDRGPQRGTPATTKSLNQTPILDILFVYTPQSQINLGFLDIKDYANTLVSDLNSYFAHSGVDALINTVAIHEISPDLDVMENGPDILTSLSEQDGIADEALVLREVYGADLVMALVQDAKTDALPFGICGLAFTPFSFQSYLNFSEFSFSFLATHCSSKDFAHEIGHNLGLAHNPESNPAGSGIFEDSQGHNLIHTHCDGSILGCPHLSRTIMSYAPGLPVPFFSSPEILDLTGVPLGNEESNAVATLKQSTFIAETFRPHQAIPTQQPSLSGLTISHPSTGTGFYQMIQIQFEGEMDHFRVYRANLPGQPVTCSTHQFRGVSFDFGTGDPLTFHDLDVTEEQDYHYGIRSVVDGQMSECLTTFSNGQPMVGMINPPSAPPKLMIEHSENHLSVWTHHDSGFETQAIRLYRVEDLYMTEFCTGEYYIGNLGGFLFYLDEDVGPGHLYTYAAQRVLLDGSLGECGVPKSKTVPTEIESPSGLVATDNEIGKIDLTWTPVEGATSYKIYSWPSSMANCPTFNKTPIAIVSRSSFSHTIQHDTSVRYRVRAEQDNSISPFSNECVFGYGHGPTQNPADIPVPFVTAESGKVHIKVDFTTPPEGWANSKIKLYRSTDRNNLCKGDPLVSINWTKYSNFMDNPPEDHVQYHYAARVEKLGVLSESCSSIVTAFSWPWNHGVVDFDPESDPSSEGTGAGGGLSSN